MRCFRRKRLHLILAVRARRHIDLLVHYENWLIHLDTTQILPQSLNNSLCKDSRHWRHWMLGGYDLNATKGSLLKLLVSKM